MAGTGPHPMIRGATPTMAQSTNLANGSDPFFSKESLSPTTTKAAPSVTPLELPGVTFPSLRKTGLNIPNFSIETSGLGNSSCSISRVFFRPSGTSIGDICLAKNPDSIAAPALCWLIRLHSSI